MKIWVGSDHRGKEYKEMLKCILIEKGHEVRDVGVSEEVKDSVDYPDYAIPVAKAVGSGGADRGVLVCASGIGMSMTANRFKGVRATLCFTPEMAETARRHNDSNILCLGQDTIREKVAKEILETWLSTPFDAGRHQRRVGKLDA